MNSKIQMWRKKSPQKRLGKNKNSIKFLQNPIFVCRRERLNKLCLSLFIRQLKKKQKENIKN
jgi:hypothetical protein